MMLWWICWIKVSKLVSTTRWKAYILRLYRKGWGLAVYFAPPSVYCYWALSSALLCYHFASPVYISLTPIALLPPRIELDSIFWELFTISSLCHCVLILTIIAYIFHLYVRMMVVMVMVTVMVMVMMWQWFLWWLWCSASALATLTCGLN